MRCTRTCVASCDAPAPARYVSLQGFSTPNPRLSIRMSMRRLVVMGVTALTSRGSEMLGTNLWSGCGSGQVAKPPSSIDDAHGYCRCVHTNFSGNGRCD